MPLLQSVCRLRRPLEREEVRHWQATPANAAPPLSPMAAAGGRPITLWDGKLWQSDL
ncbi:MAG TPA: hypothetical protein VN729_01235 [Ktedonobacteraceae bacterium]|nr:hypothetical protein [Ktedonobacteraceae bacterium]